MFLTNKQAIKKKNKNKNYRKEMVKEQFYLPVY